MKEKFHIFKHYGFGVGLAGCIVTFILTSVFALEVFNPFIYWIWIAFIPLMIYFPHGKHKSFKLYLEMFCSFLLGCVWGWLSNMIAQAFGASLIGSVLDHLVMMFFIFWISLTVLRKTPFNNLSMSFLAYALINGAFGRPLPFIGIGFMGDLPNWFKFVLLILYVIFGLVFTFLLETLGDLFNKLILKPKKEVIFGWAAENDAADDKMKKYFREMVKENQMPPKK